MGRKVIAFWLSMIMIFSLVYVLDIVIDITSSVTGTTHYVNETGSGGAYTSIQVAINVAEDGDTIYVYNGTYYENLLVYKTLNITGECRDTTIIDGGGVGDVVFVSASWSNITGFTVTGSGTVSTDAGMELNNVQNCLITHNNITSNSESGIYLWSASYNNISHNTIDDNSNGIYLDSSNDNHLLNNVVILNGGDGIILDSSIRNLISGNSIFGGSNGIMLISSEGNTVDDNTLDSNLFIGINLESSNGNNISVNSVSSSMLGIALESSNGNNITGNTVTSNLWDGIYLISSSWNNITNNTGINNENTIVLAESTSNYLFGNSMTGEGISIAGGSLEHWNTHIIDTSNKVNDKPVYYWKNQSGGSIPSDAGQVILANCDNIRVENQQIHDCPHGILLGFSSNNYLAENAVTSVDSSAIRMEYSDWNTISGGSASCRYRNAIALYSANHNRISNTTTSNSESGIYISNSEDNNVTGNTAYNNRYGIFLYGPGLNNITFNMVYNNLHGIYLDYLDEVNIIGNEIFSNTGSGINIEADSTGARIYHNNIKNNSDQAIDGNINYWDNGYPLGGNYWSDYTGYDNLSGPNQDQLGSDGIGDTPYVIDVDSQDNYPLMEPFGNGTLFGPVYNIEKDTYYDTIQEAIDDADPGNTILVSSGIYLENVIVNKTINLMGEDMNTTIIDGGGNGDVVRITADWANITGFTINNSGTSGNNAGVKIESNYTSISENNLQDNTCGIYLDQDTNWNTILINNISSNYGLGILLDTSFNNSIIGNNISANGGGIFMPHSSWNNISDNNFFSNDDWGMHLENSCWNIIMENTILNSIEGIHLCLDCENNTFIDNYVCHNRFGFGCWGGNNNNMIDNSILYNSDFGIYFGSSLHNTLASNTLIHNGIHICGDYIEFWNTHYIDTTNTVNGKSIYYWKNQTEGVVPDGAGEVILANCTNVSVENQELHNGTVGIAVGFCSNINITGNNISGGRWGIYIDNSFENNITVNNASNNIYGIYFISSSNNYIFHNNLIDNTLQGFDNDVNFWDNGYPSGGNFWSDYTGSDERSGPNQDEPGSDGIGDTEYGIDSDTIDYYPLMSPYIIIPPLKPVHNIDKGTYYDTIQEAIDDADSGNTIFVRNGTYYESVVVDVTVTLMGEDKNTTILDGRGISDVIEITADWVNITDFTITGGGWWPYAGIKLDNVQNCWIFNNNISLNDGHGIVLYSSSRNKITDNIASSNHWGIYLDSSLNNNIKGNNVSNNDEGISLESSSGNTITNNILFPNNGYAFDLCLSSNNNITGNNISHNDNGIILFRSNQNSLNGNIFISNDRYGIYLYDSSSNRLTSNQMIENGILITGDLLEYWNTHIIDTFNTVSGKPVYYWKNQTGGIIPSGAGQVILANCFNIIVENQELTYGAVGIELGFSSHNTIIDNDASSNNHYGIYLEYSNYNNITGNIVSLNNGNGIHLYYSNGNNIAANTVYSNGLYGIRLWESDLNNVTDNIAFENNLYGISVYSSDDNFIFDNNAFNNLFGIRLQESDGNNVSNNIATDNYYGIYLCLGSDNNDITTNNLADNNYGIYIWFLSNNNMIFRNNISSNSIYGILLEDCSNNRIYHNNIISNNHQAFDNRSDNYWDNGYPSGGNYWSDYTGADDFSGPGQNEEGGDGIGDSPYIIDSDTQDNYPLMEPWAPDNTPPILQLDSPSNNSIIKPGIIIDLSILDPHLYKVTYSLNGGSHQRITSPFEIETMEWEDDNYIVEVYAIDTHNNVNTKWYNFTIDSISPTVVLNSPDDGSIIKAGIPIEFSIQDIHLKQVICSINGVNEIISSPYDLNTNSWDDRSYVISINASDHAGNYNFLWFNFVIDSTSPKITLNSPDNNSFIAIEAEIDFTISDANLKKVSYTKNSGPAYTFSEPYIIDTSDWQDGEYNIKIYADDLAGNFNEKWFIFTKDTTLPSIVLNNPDNESLLFEVQTIDFDVYDENLESVYYSINQGALRIFEAPYDLDASDWEDGEYIIEIRAGDAAGWTIERWFFFKFDISPPSIASASIDEGATDVSIKTEIVIEFSEPMDTKSVESAISMDPYVDYTCSWTEDNKTLILNFSEPLEYETQYKISIGTGAKDMADRRLDDKFEFGFTTQKKPKEKEEEGVPIMYFFLTLLIAIIVVVIIVVLVIAKKKPSKEKAEPGIEIPAAIQIKCPGCNNILQFDDLGTTMNIKCPFCSMVMKVESQKSLEEQPQPQLPTMQIACPQCRHGFSVIKTKGPMQVQCPSCGIKGTLE
ncbi:MAG: right-handed parallel beta-helix repeat-containing protein [Thermoplasmata archaeon]|nr:MAG: right-handed parallel beta-helix repeat-containing protein [Thermoplasmata archaeon]